MVTMIYTKNIFFQFFQEVRIPYKKTPKKQKEECTENLLPLSTLKTTFKGSG